MSPLGWIHTIFGLIALMAGTTVICMQKGTRRHRTIGHVYLSNMFGLNVTAFFIYRLSGHFGPFHWMAVASLLILLLGMLPVFTRRPKGAWLQRHAGFVTGSYVGLLAATAAEITSRVPSLEQRFGLVVGLTSVVVIGVGVYLIQRFMPRSIDRTSAHFRRNMKLPTS